jgi:hypothetical protein
MLHDVLDIPLPTSIKDATFSLHVLFPILLFGFLIGCVGVRDARHAGLASIVERPEARETSDEDRSSWVAHGHLAGQPAE